MGRLGNLFSGLKSKTSSKASAKGGADKNSKLAKATAATKGKRGDLIQAKRTGATVEEVKAGKKKKGGLKKGAESQLGKAKGKGKLGKAKGKKAKAEPEKKKTAEELNAELEKYYAAKGEQAAPAV